MSGIYKWKTGTSHKVSAQEAGDELERIRAENGDFFTPRNVVEASVEEDAVLHPEFEWSDPIAAQKYRIGQAHELITHTVLAHVEDVPDAPPIRAYVSVRTNGAAYQFTSTVEASKVPMLREQIEKQMSADIDALVYRYKQFKGLSAALDRLRAVKKSIGNYHEDRPSA